MLVSYSIYYMGVTLRAVAVKEPLPWSWCDPQWANSDCFDRSTMSSRSNESLGLDSNNSWTTFLPTSDKVSWVYLNGSSADTSVDSVQQVNATRQQPSPEQYFENQVLQIRTNSTEYTIDHLGGVVWPLAG